MFSKPLLVFPPAPDRWSAVAALLTEESPVRRHDLERRLAQGVPDAHDAFALIPDGSKALAVACIRRRGAVGVFGQLYTHPDLRRRGLCRQLVQTLLSWFDMTRGRWLFSHTRTALHADFLTHFGFEPLQRVEHGGEPFVTLLRTPTGVTRDPYARLGSPERGEPHEGEPTGPPVRELSRADWPLVVALLQYRPGPDPRVPLPESALAAENFGLDMFEQRERGAGRVLGAFAGKWLTGVGGLAIAAGGGPTHALIAPHDQPNSELRAALEELARREGHTTVRYPLDALRPAVAPEA